MQLLCDSVCQLCSFAILCFETAKKNGCQIFPSGWQLSKSSSNGTCLLNSVQYKIIFLNSVQYENLLNVFLQYKLNGSISWVLVYNNYRLLNLYCEIFGTSSYGEWRTRGPFAIWTRAEYFTLLYTHNLLRSVCIERKFNKFPYCTVLRKVLWYCMELRRHVLLELLSLSEQPKGKIWQPYFFAVSNRRIRNMHYWHMLSQSNSMQNHQKQYTSNFVLNKEIRRSDVSRYSTNF